uniref:Uncharacterized protein n=1 Tax=Magallana gigas TaxID=29159 RepID=A0A8W8LAB5_MAGGI
MMVLEKFAISSFKTLCCGKMLLNIEMRECASLVVIIWILMKVHPTSSFSSAKYIWPLTDSTFNYEITSSTPGDYTQCGFHFDGNHPSFSGPPLNLDAYSFPFIDINIGDANEFKDFSFAMSVHISGSTGCIFHFKSMTSPGTITDVSVCIDGTTLTMELLPDPGALAPSHSVPSLQGQWVMIQAGRSQSSSEMKFIVGTTTGPINLKKTPDSYGSDVILGLPGILRIGARHDNSMALSMMVTCITMYDVTTNTGSDVGSIEDQCKPTTSVSGE